MNLPNKITISRIVMAFVIILILLFPFHDLGFDFPKYSIDGKLLVDSKYLIAGVLFIFASLTDFLDGYLARKYHMITDYGKTIDAIADKILVNSILIILSSNGFISPIITVIVIVRDSIVNTIKMIAGNKGNVVAALMSGKIKTACLMVGIILTLFYNLPFELWNLRVSDFLLVTAAILSLVSMAEYYMQNKKYLFDSKK